MLMTTYLLLFYFVSMPILIIIKMLLSGFTLIIKMKMEDRDNDTASINSSRSVVDTVKEYVTQNFQNPRIM